MREKFWKLIAKIITQPAVTDWLIKRAMRTPYDHIGGYMSRYWLVDRKLRMPFCVRIHNIRRHDADLALHDHPANYRTIILRGTYVEEDVFGRKKIFRQGDTFAGVAERFHRIDTVSPDVWTLFILGRDRNLWGFMVIPPTGDPRKIPWKEYVSPNIRDRIDI